MYEFKFNENEYIYWDMYQYICCDNPVKIFAEDDFPPDWYPAVRKPYYQLRGKPVTPQQAVEIIAKTDYLFSNVLEINKDLDIGIFEMNYFCTDGFSRPFGWVHPGGEVGQNYLFGIKWPEIREMAEALTPLVHTFPFLEFIAGISWWNEMSPARYDLMYANKSDKFYKDDDFTDNIEMGIWVHGGIIEFVNAKKAVKLYRKYDELYNGKDYRIFYPDYYKEIEKNSINRSFAEKCFKVHGIENNPGIFPGFISN
ncbi:MAG: hypothetical protein NC253_12010 [Ruminococcus sp.]|nr:hypothetical protein [Ruminococcus sp.]MCM1478749.1 hypothetical protein [Muribaculaceae bacterium]